MFPDLISRHGLGRSRFRGLLRSNQSLAPLTWLGVGGPAQLLFQPADMDDLAAFLAVLPDEIPLTAIGRGSNLLIRDGGLSGAVIRLSCPGFCGVRTEDDGTIIAGAGLADRQLSEFAARAGLGGFAFFAGIPGSVGGAVKMNAGANDGDTRAILLSARGIDRRGQSHILEKSALRMRYRQSAPDIALIYTEARFAGVPRSAEEIRAEMAAVQAHRADAQPGGVKTGGSTFKNPPGFSAWKLIEAAGGRGLRVGAAAISEKHCNFMINCGGARAADFEQLGELVRSRVQDHSGIELQWEIHRLGKSLHDAQGDLSGSFGASQNC